MMQPDIVTNPVTKETIEFLDTARRSGGRRSRFIVTLQPGGAIAAHVHRTYDERVEVVEGVATIALDGVTKQFAVGEAVSIEKGQTHAIRNASDSPMAFRVDVEPGHGGYETMLRVLCGVAREGRSSSKGIPKDPRVIGLVGTWGDSNLPGLLRVFQPLLGFLAFLGRRAGLDRELLERYAEPAAPRD